MRVAVYSTKPDDGQFLTAGNLAHRHDLSFLEPRLCHGTIPLAAGAEAVCVFVNDDASSGCSIALPGWVSAGWYYAAGFNHVDLQAAARLGVLVSRVPSYSPHLCEDVNGIPAGAPGNERRFRRRHRL
jgi:D-lactate dehydrogenase